MRNLSLTRRSCNPASLLTIGSVTVRQYTVSARLSRSTQRNPPKQPHKIEKAKSPRIALPPLQPAPQISKTDIPSSPFSASHPSRIPLGVYNDNPPPTSQQLSLASKLFTKQANYLFSTHQFHLFPVSSPAPEILILGRSNAGKSTLLNALCGIRRNNKLARTSSKPGHTKCMHVYGIGGVTGGKTIEAKERGTSVKLLKKGGLLKDKSRLKTVNRIEGEGIVIIDTPGYGMGSRSEWGKEIIKYLKGRQQLRRVLVLVDWQFGPYASDLETIQLCHEHGVPFQIVLTKVEKCLWSSTGHFDKLVKEGGKVAELVKNVPLLQAYDMRVRQTIAKAFEQEGVHMERMPINDTIWTAGLQDIPGVGILGIAELRWAIMQACGMEFGKTSTLPEGINLV